MFCVFYSFSHLLIYVFALCNISKSVILDEECCSILLFLSLAKVFYLDLGLGCGYAILTGICFDLYNLIVTLAVCL